MRIQKIALPLVLLMALLTCSANGQETASMVLPAGSKVFVAPMENNFTKYLKDAIRKKKILLTLVSDMTQAEFEIAGHSDSQKASTAKKLIRLDWHSNEQASIQIANLTTGTVVFAYSVNKASSAHGQKSTAEACAKHIKEKIESGK
jgi:hypothetical protein